MRAAALGVLVGLACGLGGYLLLGGGGGGGRGGSAVSFACAEALAPAVREVAPRQLGSLREAVARVLPERLGRLYEEGTVDSLDAWRDEDPRAPALSPTAARPGAYEMRWFAPNDDNVVADVFSFATARRARSFIAAAAGGRCREQARVSGAPGGSILPRGRNVTWVNPDGYAEADVYLQQGSRVYRVADVPAGQTKGAAGERDLSRTLHTIDTLACLLPKAGCRRGSTKLVPA